MKLKKIYLFAAVSSQYGVVNDFTRELSNAFNRKGVVSRIIEAKKNDPRAFLEEILTDPPDCTLSFNGLLPDKEGRFLSDLIKIPHVACLTDAPNHFFPLVKSAYTIITCIDESFCQVFKDFGFSRVLFLPHAASKSLEPLLEIHTTYDVLMLNSFIDYEALHSEWSSKYPPELCKVLEDAAELTLTDPNLPYMQAFVTTLDHHMRSATRSIDPRQINYEELLDDLEAYIGGKGRVNMLRSIKEATVHVFGKQEKGGWKKYLGSNHTNITIHPPVPFSQALNLMKQAKILLNYTPEIKRGFHERILNGLGSGAAVFTLDTAFIRQFFQDRKDILLFHPPHWEEFNQKINYYLEHDVERHQMVGQGREKVLEHHTWDQRAQTLIDELPAFLEQLNKG